MIFGYVKYNTDSGRIGSGTRFRWNRTCPKPVTDRFICYYNGHIALTLNDPQFIPCDVCYHTGLYFSYGDRFVLVLTATHLSKAFNCSSLLQKLHVMKIGSTAFIKPLVSSLSTGSLKKFSATIAGGFYHETR